MPEVLQLMWMLPPAKIVSRGCLVVGNCVAINLGSHSSSVVQSTWTTVCRPTWCTRFGHWTRRVNGDISTTQSEKIFIDEDEAKMGHSDGSRERNVHISDGERTCHVYSTPFAYAKYFCDRWTRPEFFSLTLRTCEPCHVVPTLLYIRTSYGRSSYVRAEDGSSARGK